MITVSIRRRLGEGSYIFSLTWRLNTSCVPSTGDVHESTRRDFGNNHLGAAMVRICLIWTRPLPPKLPAVLVILSECTVLESTNEVKAY
jgi:hypothetical protein